MPLISVSENLSKKLFTSVDNKFITKYLPALEPMAVKVYLYSLYVYQNGLISLTLQDIAKRLNISEEELVGLYSYLEEFELVKILSTTPFEVEIADADNVAGTPKKYKPDKYSDFSKSVQKIIKGRMISTNEFMEYYYFLEEYGFEQNALLMIVNYCVNLRGDDIKFQYIKKVIKSFADDGVTTAKKVDEKLSAYTSSTPALIRIFGAVGINRQPDVEDDKLYKKWTAEFGFEECAIAAAAKCFKTKTVSRLDETLSELYKNKIFDVKEIGDFAKNKNSVYTATIDVAKALGVYVQNAATYADTYVNGWYRMGFSLDRLKDIAKFLFYRSKNSFEDMDEFIKGLYDKGVVADEAVKEYLDKQIDNDKFIKKVLTECRMSRKVIDWDRQTLEKWRGWSFSDEMILKAAELSAEKSNPIAYMNGVLSAWKNEGVFSPENIKNTSAKPEARNKKAEIESHYYDLRNAAETRAEKTLERAKSDNIYRSIFDQLNELTIELAFAEVKDEKRATALKEKIEKLESDGDTRLRILGIDKRDFTPKYSCLKCNDTGYDENGNPCECMKKFINSLE